LSVSLCVIVLVRFCRLTGRRVVLGSKIALSMCNFRCGECYHAHPLIGASVNFACCVQVAKVNEMRSRRSSQINLNSASFKKSGINKGDELVSAIKRRRCANSLGHCLSRLVMACAVVLITNSRFFLTLSRPSHSIHNQSRRYRYVYVLRR